MRKKSYVLFGLLFLFLLAGCNQNTEDPCIDEEPQKCIDDDGEELLELLPDTIITMDILDNYMFRDDVQYVDLRNHEQLFRSGFIYSFENIPFFDYLDYRAFDRNGTYEFNPDQLLNEEQLTRFFDPEKAIFLTADGCIRSGYIKDVLNHLGYERVYVIGAYYEYDGEHRVLGDGYYENGTSFFAEYIDPISSYTYHIYGAFDLDRHPIDFHINVFDANDISIRSEGYSDIIDYNSQYGVLESYLTRYGPNFNDLYEYLTSSEDNDYKNIEGFTIGFDPGLLKAIQQLTASY